MYGRVRYRMIRRGRGCAAGAAWYSVVSDDGRAAAKSTGAGELRLRATPVRFEAH